ncbi:MAG: histone deacetylase [Ginsengibacter sp.]
MIAYHPSYVHPLPKDHRFPMIKYELLHEQLLRQGVVEETAFFEPNQIEEVAILLAHSADYWQKLKSLSLTRLEILRTGFPLSAELIKRERLIAAGTLNSSLNALRTGFGFNIAGGTHHAGSNWGEGFCLLNDQAIAAKYLLEYKEIKKILIIDLDVHQGNGTAEIFYDDDRVFTFSMHGKNNFPFKKEKSNLDIGVEDGMKDKEYLNILERTLPDLFENVDPHFVFYLSGVDVLATDKMGKLKLSIDGCRKRDEMVYSLCKQYKIPVQTSMGGGYSSLLHQLVDAHCNTFKVGLSILE